MTSLGKRIYIYPRFIALILTFAFAAPVADAYAQSESPISRFSVGLFVGASRPTENLFRQLYGSVQTPVSLEARCRIFRQLYVFSSYGYLATTGRAELMAIEGIRESDPLKLRMNLLKAGSVYAFPVRRMLLLVGGGINYSTYRERWESAGFTTEGGKLGFLARAGIEYPLFKRLSLNGRIDFSHLQKSAESASENETNLGGLELSIGIAFRVK
jgi:hypothetical protein